jgi:hypothetical protein
MHACVWCTLFSKRMSGDKRVCAPRAGPGRTGAAAAGSRAAAPRAPLRLRRRTRPTRQAGSRRSPRTSDTVSQREWVTTIESEQRAERECTHLESVDKHRVDGLRGRAPCRLGRQLCAGESGIRAYDMRETTRSTKKPIQARAAPGQAATDRRSGGSAQTPVTAAASEHATRC